MPPLSLTEHFADLAPNYDVILCDVWGVVHNSLVASPQAHDALSRFRNKGGAVILITNAPRPGLVVKRQLDQMGVPEHAYDGIVSSGDVTRGVMQSRPGQSVFHIGPERDLPLFKDLDAHFATVETADYAVCTGLFDDETETAESYRGTFAKMRQRNMFMLCANPDLVVERGTQLIYCAGALADLYHLLGGDVLYAGKPHPPIYQEALRRAAAARHIEAKPERTIAIGDSIRTDMKGAAQFGVDSILVTDGIHAEELGGRHAPDPRVISEVLAREGVAPTAVMRKLVW
ncbi:MAG: TIGR01459 family HAD-type hydrolase [Xanthobacteraceae bacterium]